MGCSSEYTELAVGDCRQEALGLDGAKNLSPEYLCVIKTSGLGGLFENTQM